MLYLFEVWDIFGVCRRKSLFAGSSNIGRRYAKILSKSATKVIVVIISWFFSDLIKRLVLFFLYGFFRIEETQLGQVIGKGNSSLNLKDVAQITGTCLNRFSNLPQGKVRVAVMRANITTQFIPARRWSNILKLCLGDSYSSSRLNTDPG